MTQRIIEVYVPLGKTPEGEVAFFDQFKRPRCTVCEGTGEDSVTIDPSPCWSCRGTGHERESAWEAQQLAKKDYLP